METFVRRGRSALLFVFDPRLVVACLGLILSVILHELFHICMHWGNVVGIQLFSESGTIAEVIVRVPRGYDLETEEIIAYGITITVMLVTFYIVAKIHDSMDTRSLSEILHITPATPKDTTETQLR